jgi:Predicted xylanase/chitin deacetylase
LKCKFFGRKHGRTVALVLALSLVFVTLCLPASAAEGITATLTASKNVVHSGETFTLTLALSSPAGQDVNAEISRGDQSFIIPVAAGQSQGSVEVTAGSYAKTTSEAFALKENGAFRSVESDKVSVRVLPKPQMSFNATFLMVAAGRKLTVNFKCKNYKEMTVPLPVTLRKADGTILASFTVDQLHHAFSHQVTIEKNWQFPYSLEIHNELTDSAAATVPVMVIDADRPGIRRVDTTEKKIALGFDCGYNNIYTDYIMDMLDEYDAKVTFFVTGYFCSKFPDELKKIHEKGHEIGNHTMTHPRLTKLGDTEIYSEIKGVNDMVYKITGIHPRLMRPPEGAANSNVIAISRMTGCETVYWTEDSGDWNPKKSAEYIISHATENMGEGCILLFHNSAPKTEQTLRAILEDYKAKGLKIVPISDLLYTGHYTVDAKGVQKPDPDYQTVSVHELLGDPSFSVKASAQDGSETFLPLRAEFDSDKILLSKEDISRIKADPSLVEIAYDFGGVTAPVRVGDRIGGTSFRYGGRTLFSATMYAVSDFPATQNELSRSDLPVSGSDLSGRQSLLGSAALNSGVLALVLLGAILMYVRNRRKD